MYSYDIRVFIEMPDLNNDVPKDQPIHLIHKMTALQF